MAGCDNPHHHFGGCFTCLFIGGIGFGRGCGGSGFMAGHGIVVELVGVVEVDGRDDDGWQCWAFTPFCRATTPRERHFRSKFGIKSKFNKN